MGFSLNAAVKEAQRCMNCGAGAWVDHNLCVGCLTCVRVCPFEVPKIAKGNTTAYIDGDCQSCGLCIVECPAKAISFKTPLEDCGKDALEAVFQEKFVHGIKPFIINFYCQYGAYKETKESSTDDLLVFHFRRVGVLGLGKVDPSLYLRAFELGAHGVLITACKGDTCHFCKEQEWVERRSKFTANSCVDWEWIPEGFKPILFLHRMAKKFLRLLLTWLKNCEMYNQIITTRSLWN